MEDLDRIEARKLRDMLIDIVPIESRADVSIGLCTVQETPRIWGVKINDRAGKTLPKILKFVPDNLLENIRVDTPGPITPR